MHWDRELIGQLAFTRMIIRSTCSMRFGMEVALPATIGLSAVHGYVSHGSDTARGESPNNCKTMRTIRSWNQMNQDTTASMQHFR